jgi:hypothetical protein
MPSVERWDDRSEDILGLVSTYEVLVLRTKGNSDRD